MNAIKTILNSWHTNSIAILFWTVIHRQCHRHQHPHKKRIGRIAFMVVELLFFLYFTYFVSVFFFCGIQFRLCMLITPMNGVCECVSVSINIVIYHLLNAFKQQRAGKHFAKSKSKEMVTFNSTHTHLFSYGRRWCFLLLLLLLYDCLFVCLARFFRCCCFV